MSQHDVSDAPIPAGEGTEVFLAAYATLVLAGGGVELALGWAVHAQLGDAELAVVVAGDRTGAQLVELLRRLVRNPREQGAETEARLAALDAAKTALETRNEWIHSTFKIVDGEPIKRYRMGFGNRQRLPVRGVNVTPRKMHEATRLLLSTIDKLRDAFGEGEVLPLLSLE